MRVLLIGSGHLGLALFSGLLETAGRNPAIDLVGIVPWSTTKKGKNLVDEGETQLVNLIRKSDVPIIPCVGVNHFEFSEQLVALTPDVLLVGCWGEILKSHLLNRPDLKVVNCHPAKLPAHRGSNPYASAIMMGETETGVTFHWITEGIDDGPIVLQQTVPIFQDDTGVTIRERCCGTALAMIPDLLACLEILEQKDSSPQPEEGKSYYPQITLADGAIDWTHPPEILHNRLRGLRPWLSSYSLLEGKLLYIFHWLPLTDRPETPDWPHPAAPGTIIHRQGTTLWIQSALPEKAYHCDDYQFYLGLGFLPRPVSRWLSRAIIRPGHRFYRPG